MEGRGDVWGVLQIEATADVRIIKRAYVQQLKITRAHQDTERFIALREAYETALRIAGTADTIRPDNVEGSQPAQAEAAKADQQPVPLFSAHILLHDSSAHVLPHTANVLPAHTFDAAPKLPPSAQAPASIHLPPPPEAQQLEALFAAYEQALQDRTDSSRAQTLLEAIIASPQMQGFKQRERIEARLVRLLCDSQPDAVELYQIPAMAFSWKTESMVFERRFPRASNFILTRLQTLNSLRVAREVRTAREAEALYRDLAPYLEGGFLAWFLTVFYRPDLRPQLVRLCKHPLCEQHLSRKKRLLWQASLAYLPPIGMGGLVFSSFVGFLFGGMFWISTASRGDVAISAVMAASILGAPFAYWACIRLPIHLSLHPGNLFGQYWPAWVLAILMFPAAQAIDSHHGLLITGMVSRATLLVAVAWFSLHHVGQQRFFAPGLQMAGILGAMGIAAWIFGSPGADWTAIWPVGLLLALQGLLALSMLRLYQKSKKLALLLFCVNIFPLYYGVVLAAVKPPLALYPQVFCTVAALWGSESLQISEALIFTRTSRSDFLLLGFVFMAIVGALLANGPVLKTGLSITALLVAELVRPAAAYCHQYHASGQRRPRLDRMVGVVLLLFAFLPFIPWRYGNAALAAFVNAMLVLRFGWMVWAIFVSQHLRSHNSRQAGQNPC